MKPIEGAVRHVVREDVNTAGKRGKEGGRAVEEHILWNYLYNGPPPPKKRWERRRLPRPPLENDGALHSNHRVTRRDVGEMSEGFFGNLRGVAGGICK